MDLALNNLQRLICHKTKQTKPNLVSYNCVQITYTTLEYQILERNSWYHTTVGKIFVLDMNSWNPKATNYLYLIGILDIIFQCANYFYYTGILKSI